MSTLSEWANLIKGAALDAWNNWRSPAAPPIDPKKRWIEELPDYIRFYGGSGTIHGDGAVNVELFQGRVVAVWYRCSSLKFTETEVDISRAAHLQAMYLGGAPDIYGVVFE